MKFENTHSQNAQNIMCDVLQKLYPTKAMKGFDFLVAGDTINFMHADIKNSSFAKATLIISEAFNGFHLYHVNDEGQSYLLASHNLGATSHILDMCRFASYVGSKVPATMDTWLVKTLVKRLARLKAAGPHLLKLKQDKRDAVQMLFCIEAKMGLKIPAFVFDSFDRMATSRHDDIVAVNYAYLRMIQDEDVQRSHFYTAGDGFLSPEELEKKVHASEDDDDEFDDEDDESEHGDELELEHDDNEEELRSGEIEESVDLLNCLSTPGLISLFNYVATNGPYNFEESDVYVLSGMERRNEIIQELATMLSCDELCQHAYHTPMKSEDANHFLGA